MLNNSPTGSNSGPAAHNYIRLLHPQRQNIRNCGIYNWSLTNYYNWSPHATSSSSSTSGVSLKKSGPHQRCGSYFIAQGPGRSTTKDHMPRFPNSIKPASLDHHRVPSKCIRSSPKPRSSRNTIRHWTFWRQWNVQNPDVSSQTFQIWR